jgi:hypothetical protein
LRRRFEGVEQVAVGVGEQSGPPDPLDIERRMLNPAAKRLALPRAGVHVIGVKV